MKIKTNYAEAPKGIAESIENGLIIKDFLPPPEQLIRKQPTQKVTISLTKNSLKFFKKAGKKSHIPYQQLIRKVVEQYSIIYQKH